jgi:hypothetical protein
MFLSMPVEKLLVQNVTLILVPQLVSTTFRWLASGSDNISSVHWTKEELRQVKAMIGTVSVATVL